MAGALLSIGGVCGAGLAQEAATATPAAAPAASVQEILERNTLVGPGKRPFELKVDFQVFDMQGQPEDQGTLTYRYLNVHDFTVGIDSKLLGVLQSDTPAKEQTPARRREVVLLGSLLAAYIHPVDAASAAMPVADLKTSHVRSLELRCYNPSLGQKHIDPLAKVCIDQDDVIRQVFWGMHETLRNRDGTFSATKVTLDVVEANLGRRAITGHLTDLRAIQPPAEPVKAGETASVSSSESPVRLTGGVVAGRKLSGTPPIYPEDAKSRRVMGSVILAAVISKEGRITLLTPIASADESLTKAATEAVSTWTYQPYLLNGAPVEVTTTVTVNFNLNRF